MPKLEAKQIQKELESGLLWPVYWLYGHEKMKSRELLRRIRRTVLGPDEADAAGPSLSEDILDASEVTSVQIVDAVRSLSFGIGPRFVLVRDAHLLKDTEALSELFGERSPRDSLGGVCVLLSNDLDGRKKFSKLLVEKAAVVPCEDIPDADRPGWITYLSKRKNLVLSDDTSRVLALLDPWSLDIVDRELEKIGIGRTIGLKDTDLIAGGGNGDVRSEQFVDILLGKNREQASHVAASFSSSPEVSIPLLGLLAWNVRQLAVALADRESGGRSFRPNPYLAERLRRWSSLWTLDEVLRLQRAIEDLDFETKQTPKLPAASWENLISTGLCGGRTS